MLTDEVIIKITSGKGGDGSVSFRHEKYVPKGGPDGGDGGDGGDVIFQASRQTNTLTFYNTQKEFKAQNGANGQANRSFGKDGKDLVLTIPPGTIIYQLLPTTSKDKNFRKVADLLKDKQELLVAKGGNGGWGNVHFATSTHQTPMQANPGQPGVEKIFKLELRFIADVGLIGLPNSGKSTLLARITHAKPKIANYPFTTLEPNLGICTVDDFSFIVADIPGLISGAADGKGLGFKFLRHVQRTRLLVHLIDCQNNDILSSYKEIREELSKFSRLLVRKPEIVVISKIDSLDAQTQSKLHTLIADLQPIFISSASGQGVKELLYEIKKRLNRSAA